MSLAAELGQYFCGNAQFKKFRRSSGGEFGYSSEQTQLKLLKTVIRGKSKTI